MQDFLTNVYWGNTGRAYLETVISILVVIIILKSLKHFVVQKISNWAKKTGHPYSFLIFDIVARFVAPMLYLDVALGFISRLELSNNIDKSLTTASLVINTYFIIRIILYVLNTLFDKRLEQDPNGDKRKRQFRGIMTIVTVMIWILGFLYIMQNTGHNVNTFLTGLGIGGIAVALAAQNILSDIFNYFVIFFDRPFEVGDAIAFDSFSGSVVYIGIKTTRLTSASGEQLVISNSNLLGKVISNYKRQKTRLVQIKIGVDYATSTTLLAEIPNMIKEIIDNTPNVNFGRAHLNALNNSSIDFEIVYTLPVADYNIYMDANQSINLAILKKFSEENINMPFPTQTVILQQNS